MLGRAAVLVVALAAGCAVTAPGASDANLALAKSRAARGGALFDTACSSCHGPRGEGLSGAPAVIGVTGLSRYPRDQVGMQLYQDPNQVQRQNQDRVPGLATRAEFVTARDLYDYVWQHAPKVKQVNTARQAKEGSAAPLTEEDCWALVNFMLVAHGSSVPEQEISAANARDVLIRAP